MTVRSACGENAAGREQTGYLHGPDFMLLVILGRWREIFGYRVVFVVYEKNLHTLTFIPAAVYYFLMVF